MSSRLARNEKSGSTYATILTDGTLDAFMRIDETAICFVFDWTAVPDAMNRRKFDKATKNDAGTNLES